MKRTGLWWKFWPCWMLLILATACTKIDVTRLGADLIPVVDNINTFDTYLKVIANNFIPEDSTRINFSEEHPLGGITTDPLFGASKATMFFEMKPTIFPFSFTPRDSLIAFDSAVMVLRYTSHYGDSIYPLTVNLYEVDRKMIPDTAQKPTYTLAPDLGINYSRMWGQKTMQARQFRDTITLKRDTVVKSKVTNQLRIPLNANLARALFFQDSTITGAFHSDSTYKQFLPGFALEAQGNPEVLFYFLLGQNSKIEFYYRTRVIGGIDTAVTSFPVTSTSGHAVKFQRFRNGAEVVNHQTPNPETGLEQIFIESTPGTMARIRIPGIDTLSNMVIHRAELRVTQYAPTPPQRSQLTAPFALYLDAEYPNEPGVFRGIPFDLSPFSPYFCFPGGGIDFNIFGGIRKNRLIDGELYSEYVFNITRYLQGVVTRLEPRFNFRLSAPYYMEYRDCINNNFAFPPQVFPFQLNNAFINRIGQGRVRVAGGNHPDPRLRMQFRVIYSRI